MFKTKLRNIELADAADFASQEEYTMLRLAEDAGCPVFVLECAGPEGYFDVVVQVGVNYAIEVQALNGWHLQGYDAQTNRFSYK